MTSSITSPHFTSYLPRSLRFHYHNYYREQSIKVWRGKFNTNLPMQFSMLFLGNLDFQVWPGDWYLFSILITTGKKTKSTWLLHDPPTIQEWIDIQWTMTFIQWKRLRSPFSLLPGSDFYLSYVDLSQYVQSSQILFIWLPVFCFLFRKQRFHLRGNIIIIISRK